MDPARTDEPAQTSEDASAAARRQPQPQPEPEPQPQDREEHEESKEHKGREEPAGHDAFAAAADPDFQELERLRQSIQRDIIELSVSLARHTAQKSKPKSRPVKKPVFQFRK